MLVRGDVDSFDFAERFDLANERLVPRVRPEVTHAGEMRSEDGAASHQVTCHADDGRGIKAAAELRENWRIRLQPDGHCLAKQRAKLLLIAALAAVPDDIAVRERPERAD